MKILIDISQIVHGTGVSTYTKKLVENLLGLDTENEYALFGGSLRKLTELKKFTKSLEGKFEERLIPLPPGVMELLWNRLHTFPIDWLAGKTDVFHSSDWTEPPSSAFKVTFVHDIAPLKFPKLTHPKVVAVHQRKLAWAKKEVDRVMVPSEATAEDLVGMGIDKKKIRIVPEASATKKSTKAKVEKIKSKFKIPNEYILAVGVHPRKNTEKTIEAFEKVKPGEDLKLVVAGEHFMEVEERRGVRFVGHVGDEDLSALYTGAAALVYPSLHEGFGIPVLDAMSVGTPVVTSNISSMPEVAGDAAVLVDPTDTDSIAEGIEVALRQKKTLAKKGKIQAAKFSWEKTAKRTLEVYKEAK